MINYQKGDTVGLYGTDFTSTVDSICVPGIFDLFDSMEEAKPYITDLNRVNLIVENQGGIGYSNAVLIKKGQNGSRKE